MRVCVCEAEVSAGLSIPRKHLRTMMYFLLHILLLFYSAYRFNINCIHSQPRRTYNITHVVNTALKREFNFFRGSVL